MVNQPKEWCKSMGGPHFKLIQLARILFFRKIIFKYVTQCGIAGFTRSVSKPTTISVTIKNGQPDTG